MLALPPRRLRTPTSRWGLPLLPLPGAPGRVCSGTHFLRRGSWKAPARAQPPVALSEQRPGKATHPAERSALAVPSNPKGAGAELRAGGAFDGADADSDAGVQAGTWGRGGLTRA